MEAKELGRQARQRRGGHNDGIVSASAFDGLPEAVPVAVGCSAALRAEMEHLPDLLVSSVDWTQRVDALLRLEGLVQSGAAGFATFPELLLGVRDSLAAQMQERRSAVSRQACHTVCVLAAACGTSFEPLAVHLLPVVFKTLAMGIQIVSEAADACTYAMLAACPSPRLLPKLCSVVAGDRNGRLRQSAAEFLLRAVEGWEPAIYERQLECVERAVLAAVQDAHAETRVVGRSLYGAYARSWPAQAQAMLARLERDRQLQDKLIMAAEEYVPGMLPEGPSLSQPGSRRSSLGNSGSSTPPCGLPRTSAFPAAPGSLQQGGAVRLVPLVPKLALSGLSSAAESMPHSPSQPSSTRSAAPAASGSLMQGIMCQQLPATARENQPDNRVAPVQATPRTMFPKSRARREAAATADAEAEVEPGQLAASGRERLAPRRSVGGAGARMSIANFRRQQNLGDVPELPGYQTAAAPGAALVTLQRPAGLQRGSVRAPLPPLPLSQAALPELQQHVEPAAWPLGLERQASSIQEDSEVCSSVCTGREEAIAGVCPPASLAPLLARLGKSGVDWGNRVSVFQVVQATLEQSGNSHVVAADVTSNTDRLVAALLEGCGDAHFRVAAAALAALGVGLASPCSRAFEPQLDRVMTALFARVVDPKEQIRVLVDAALAAALAQHSADVVLGALARSLQANRAPRVKCAVMDFFARAVRGGGEERQGLLKQLMGPFPRSALGGLLRSLLQLTTDKNPDIRRSAADAVAAAYHGGEAQAVLNTLHSLPPADLLMVQRAIGPAIHQQQQGSCSEAHVVPAPLSSRPGRDSEPSHQQSGSLTSRRQSSEGLKLPPQEEHRRQENSGSLNARSKQGSRAGSSSSGAGKAQTAGPAPADQHTPQPPSPFLWRVQSASPLGTESAGAAADVAASPAAEPAANGAVTQAALQLRAEQRLEVRVPTGTVVPFNDVMAAQLERLMVQLEAGPSAEALQGLSRLAHVLPAAAWPPCFDQVMAAVCAALGSTSLVLRDTGLMLARDLAAAVLPSLFLPTLPLLLPMLLACAAEQEAREIVLAADEALEALLLRAPPQSCLGVLAPRLPAIGDSLSTDRQQGAELHATIRSLRRVVVHMQPAGLSAHLQPLLLPGLCTTYRSPLTDVRKATVDCLISIWLVVGDAIKPHLEPLSASQLKLLDIYHARSHGQEAWNVFTGTWPMRRGHFTTPDHIV